MYHETLTEPLVKLFPITYLLQQLTRMNSWAT